MSIDTLREQDIQELCKQIINASPIPEYNDCGYTQCPFCLEEGHWNIYDLSGIKHDYNCAYLIAKDLLTQRNTK